MCLTIYKTSVAKPLVPLVAAYDIPVYKIIFCDNVSIHRWFQYSPNTTYTLDTPLNPIAEGVHLYEVHEGFHSYKNSIGIENNHFDDFTRNDTRKCVEFFIPKGARYFEGVDRDIVSDSIRSGDLNPIFRSA